ncbi:hypothetical protein, partial [Segatella buccae]|uniref:hypothetical protein n=1 Tax=Segatella buccae TaxID=28126 RepID=UPI0028D8F3B7
PAARRAAGEAFFVCVHRAAFPVRPEREKWVGAGGHVHTCFTCIIYRTELTCQTSLFLPDVTSPPSCHPPSFWFSVRCRQK